MQVAMDGYNVCTGMIECFGNDVRRISHALKVCGFAVGIGRSCGLGAGDMEILEAAALLHDIGIHEAERVYGSTGGKYQEELGPGVAEPILERAGFDAQKRGRVKFLIGNHHSYGVDGGPLLQILFEADFLVNAFEDGLPREAVRAAESKIFRTEAGRRYLNVMMPG